VKYPQIKTPLPGPRVKELIDVDREFVSPSYTRIYPLVAESARGLWINDPDGNTFLDYTSGIAVCGTGHCHPRVVAAIKKQADRLLHMSGTDFYYTPQILLSQKLASLAPGPGAYKPIKSISATPAQKRLKLLSSWLAGTPAGS
jgi:4-aminobutyrate aminotransferase